MNVEHLGTGETEIASIKVMPSPLLFWLKVELQASEKRIVGRKPNTFLGLIPTGYENIMFPLKQVAGITVNTRVKPLRLLIGILFFLGGLSSDFAKGGFIISLIGAALVIGAMQAALVIQNTGGGKQDVEVSLFNKGDIQNFASKVRSHLIEL